MKSVALNVAEPPGKTLGIGLALHVRVCIGHRSVALNVAEPPGKTLGLGLALHVRVCYL